MEDFTPAKKQIEKEIREAYIFLREKNHTVPSETLEFMKDAAIEKLWGDGKINSSDNLAIKQIPVKELIQRLNDGINKTPTGDLRNLLCDVNIALTFLDTTT